MFNLLPEYDVEETLFKTYERAVSLLIIEISGIFPELIACNFILNKFVSPRPL